MPTSVYYNADHCRLTSFSFEYVLTAVAGYFNRFIFVQIFDNHGMLHPLVAELALLPSMAGSKSTSTQLSTTNRGRPGPHPSTVPLLSSYPSISSKISLNFILTATVLLW